MRVSWSTLAGVLSGHLVLIFWYWDSSHIVQGAFNGACGIGILYLCEGLRHAAHWITKVNRTLRT